MGLIIYNILNRIFNLLLLVYSNFNAKAKLLIAGRQGAFNSIEDKLIKEEKNLWFHCASLGEFEQALPLIEAIQEMYPQYQRFVSFFSPSGYEYQKDNPIADGIFYLPEDTESNAKSLLDVLNPTAVFFIKYEYWYHYLNACNQKDIPVFSVSTILRPDQVFFKFYGSFYRRMLSKFHFFFVQNEETLELLKSVGLENAIISGDTRFDRVNTILKKHTPLKFAEDFKGNSRLVVLGSTWSKDINLWIQYIKHHHDLKFVIAPHNISEEEITYIEEKIQVKTLRYSNIGNGLEDVQVLIIDNIGMLSSIYKYADITYVGGAFGEGLHNILEPATYGKPVIIGKGKLNKKYHEVQVLIKGGGAFEVSDPIMLKRVMDDLLMDEAFYTRACQASRSYVNENLGSTTAILENLKTILS
jgi:3-deoxy-D-manno-octulosonic-acid transferase